MHWSIIKKGVEEVMEKKCHDCEYRGSIPGDAHSCCKHPYVKDNPIIELSCIMAIAVRTQLGQEQVGIFEPLNIEANPHGVKSGWFCCPTNFDPVWLTNCDGFKEKE